MSEQRDSITQEGGLEFRAKVRLVDCLFVVVVK
jgi:hypothetical protein